jgi:hypothetical protein
MRAIPREVLDGCVSEEQHAYAFGLWCADGYWWSSSIGISNTEPELVVRFGNYLASLFESDRLRLRIYRKPNVEADSRVLALTSRVSICSPVKMKRIAYHLYVNSRPLLRSFRVLRGELTALPAEYLGSYFAGRFDGDGSWGVTPRIAYSTVDEAQKDRELLEAAGITRTSVLSYAKANEHCIYIHVADQERFRSLIEPFAWKVNHRCHPVETATASLPGPTGPNL